ARWVAAAGEAAPEPTGVLDPAALAEVARLQRPGRPDLVSAIVERFRDEAPRRVEALREAIERGDAVAVSDCAHSLKGDSRRIGGTEVGQLCAEIELLGRSGTLANASELGFALSAAMDRLSIALQGV